MSLSAVGAQERSGWNPAGEQERHKVVETILLIEDEAFVREVTCEVLENAGYRVLSAKDSAEGASLHERHLDEIDLLITDIVLPAGNGRELAGKLKKKAPGLKALLVSGYAEQIGAQKQDAIECLAKPFSSTALLQRVRRVLEQEKGRLGAESAAMHAGDSA